MSVVSYPEKRCSFNLLSSCNQNVMLVHEFKHRRHTCIHPITNLRQYFPYACTFIYRHTINEYIIHYIYFCVHICVCLFVYVCASLYVAKAWANMCVSVYVYRCLYIWMLMKIMRVLFWMHVLFIVSLNKLSNKQPMTCDLKSLNAHVTKR